MRALTGLKPRKRRGLILLKKASKDFIVPSPYKILNSYIIENPFDNRKLIAEYAKNKKGVYIFEILNKKLHYVGSSINLYSRVCSYSTIACNNSKLLLLNP